jgi:hypothetical protein
MPVGLERGETAWIPFEAPGTEDAPEEPFPAAQRAREHPFGAFHEGTFASGAHGGRAPAEGALAAAVDSVGRDRGAAEDLDVRPEGGPRQIVLAPGRISAPVDEQARLGRRRQIALPRAGGGGECRRTVLGGVPRDRGGVPDDARRVAIEVSGERLAGVGRLEVGGDVALNAVQPGGKAQGLRGGGRLGEKRLRANCAALELRDDGRDSSRGGALPPSLRDTSADGVGAPTVA